MTLFSRAVAFAAKMHDGAVRKGTEIPYIVHPVETAAIAATITDDEEVLAAAVLHDVMEDCGVSEEELAGLFGARVAAIVLAESQMGQGDPRESWEQRKREAIEKLKRGDRDQKIVALGDKLSNMRAISRDYELHGEAIFFRFHQHDKRRHAWYYRSCAALLEDELGDTDAWRELDALIRGVFAGIPHGMADERGEACAG